MAKGYEEGIRQQRKDIDLPLEILSFKKNNLSQTR